ncbi:MAG TPA: arylesterase [Betaproteobacteria bacterium]|nr:arylesterase [Betaproteobacteria bacterium]
MRGFLWLLALSAVLGGCGRTPRLAPLTGRDVVVAFGDSLTYGVGAAAGRSYPAVLARLIGRRVVNAGAPGEVTAEGLKRLPGVLDKIHPAIMILCLGGNDMLRKLGERQTADHLRAMVRLARKRHVAVVLIGVPRPGIFASPPAFYKDIADEFHLPYEGWVLRRILTDRALKSDPIHPNALGYRKLAEAVAALLARSGAVEKSRVDHGARAAVAGRRRAAGMSMVTG